MQRILVQDHFMSHRQYASEDPEESTLSALTSATAKFDSGEPGILEEVFVYNITLVEMSTDYRSKLLSTYKGDKKWAKILESKKKRLLKEGKPVEGVNMPHVHFILHENLIYYRDNLCDRERLCIPKKLEQKIFELAHDEHSHGGFHRTYERIVNNTDDS